MSVNSYNHNNFRRYGLWVKGRESIELLPFESITHIHHYGGMSRVYKGEQLLRELRMPLSGLERIMPGNRFFRPHRNFIINKDYISRYDENNAMILFEGGRKIPLSRRRKKSFRVFMNESNNQKNLTDGRFI